MPLNHNTMKKILFIFLIGLVGISSQAQFTKANLQATGLTCAMCSNAINKALMKVPFVESVKSDIKNSSFSIVFKEGQAVSIDAIKDAVEDAGFSVGSLQVTGKFDAVQVAEDKHVKIGDAVYHFLNTKNEVLEGEKTITVVDKDFLTSKQFKKITAGSKMSCVNTGKAEQCCQADGISAGTRVYHVTI
jgi:copper chaperone CopZ